MKRNDLHGLIISLFFVISLESIAGDDARTLTVHVDGARPNTGQAIASLFSSVDNYLEEPVAQQTMLINAEGRVRFVFNELEAGTYAVSIVYDEDGDGQLDTGFLGIPSEQVGFSNNARGSFGPPSFEDASFGFPKSETITIFLGEAGK